MCISWNNKKCFFSPHSLYMLSSQIQRYPNGFHAMATYFRLMLSSRNITEYFLNLGHDLSLPHILRFIIHWTSHKVWWGSYMLPKWKAASSRHRITGHTAVRLVQIADRKIRESSYPTVWTPFDPLPLWNVTEVHIRKTVCWINFAFTSTPFPISIQKVAT